MFRNDGYLVTDAHLLQSASAVAGRRWPTAGRCPARSSAPTHGPTSPSIKIDAGQVPVATLGSATELQIGQTAIAIGAPRGPSGGPSVTVGVVSALGQQVEQRRRRRACTT